jgi:hypothetical protein
VHGLPGYEYVLPDPGARKSDGGSSIMGGASKLKLPPSFPTKFQPTKAVSLAMIA